MGNVGAQGVQLGEHGGELSHQEQHRVGVQRQVQLLGGLQDLRHAPPGDEVRHQRQAAVAARQAPHVTDVGTAGMLEVGELGGPGADRRLEPWVGNQFGAQAQHLECAGGPVGDDEPVAEAVEESGDGGRGVCHDQHSLPKGRQLHS